MGVFWDPRHVPGLHRDYGDGKDSPGYRGWGSGSRVEGLGLEELLEARSKVKDWLSGPFPLLPKTLKHTSPHS